ncbi:hypothetical protein [Streptomyces luteireticuli]|uniref:hypothetical protein n=1 Tax=Streptomyces luteireticuli TaxID=173858 RepID=UPI0035585FA4
MPSTQARVARVADHLAAAGCAPRVIDRETHVHIEAEMPDDLSAAAFDSLTAALAAADWWGVVTGSKRGRAVWAAVDKQDPVAAEAATGRDRQP